MWEAALSEQKKMDHQQKWRGASYEEVAGQTAGHLIDPPDFNTVERLANIKRGTEVVLAGVASQMDAYDVILKERAIQDLIISQEKIVVKDYEKMMSDGLSDQDKAEVELWKVSTIQDLHQQFKRTRVRFAQGLTGSLIHHVLNETRAIDGKLEEHMVDVNKAQVLRDDGQIEKLLGGDKKKRSLRHPLG